jgi:hypothetical protein
MWLACSVASMTWQPCFLIIIEVCQRFALTVVLNVAGSHLPWTFKSNFTKFVLGTME